MVESKKWNWDLLDKKKKIEWKEPAIESYYLINRWKRQKKKYFLDIGCGLGRHSIQFAKSGFNVNSIDLSQEAIGYAQKWAKCEKVFINFKKCDMIELNFEKEYFDCILCRNVISHTDTEGIITIINQIYDLLKKDGECFLTLGSKNSDIFKNLNNPRVDSNTAIRMDEGPEKVVPHFYADEDIILKLFKKFKIIYLSQIQDLKTRDEGGFKSYWHYFVLIKKCL